MDQCLAYFLFLSNCTTLVYSSILIPCYDIVFVSNHESGFTRPSLLTRQSAILLKMGVSVADHARV